MRSSKQRQRNKQNRNNRPSGGNIINRVFDSSGPEGKVRGTPAQIIEKYLQLHRDAQLAGDRVNAENFAQHAEHYTRLLAEAQRDIDRAREEQEQFQRDRQQERDRQMEFSRDQQQQRDRDQQRERDHQQQRERERAARFRAQEEASGGLAETAEPSFLSQPLFPVMVADPQDDMAPDAGLVETPEEQRAARPERPRREDRGFEGRERRPRRDREERRLEPQPEAAAPAPEPVAAEPAPAAPVGEPPAAEAAKAERPRRPRKPRAPRSEGAPAETVAPPDAAE